MRLMNSAIDDDGMVEYYAHGSCHVLAIAAHEAFGDHVRPRGFRVMLDPFECAWVNPEDPDDTLNATVHVYAVFDLDGREVALDVFGLRALEDAEQDCMEIYSPGILAWEDCTEIENLQRYICRGDGSPDDDLKPLHAVNRRLIDQAIEDLQAAFPEGLRDIPHHPPSMPTPFDQV